MVARYSGDATHASATSAPVTVLVVSTPTFGFTETSKDMALAVNDFAVGDFNGDHKPDLVAVGWGNVLQVAPGNGDGTFGSPITSVTPGDAINPVYVYVATGDFNEDGRLDLALSNAADERIEIAFGHGDGTFGEVTNLSTPHGRVVVADFNGDSHADLAVLHSSTSTVGIFLGNGDGSFSAAGEASFAPNTSLSPLIVGDLNGDGKPDLLTIIPADPNGGFVRDIVWIQGNGDGTFGTGFSFPLTNIGYTPYDQLALGDLNGDGKVDLVAAVYPDVLAVWLGNGDGTFGNPIIHHGEYQAGATGIVINDFNNDGHQDVLVDLQVASSTDSIVQLWLGWGDGNLLFPSTLPSPAEQLTSLIAADFDGDGRPDLVSRKVNDSSVAVLKGVAAPFLYIAKWHSQTFTQGQQGVTASVNVSNDSFALPTSGLVTVKEYLPGGLTLTSMSGPGWTCLADTCTRSDSLSPGGSYPLITITADIHSDALFSELDYAIASGGGSLAAEGRDTLVILLQLSLSPL